MTDHPCCAANGLVGTQMGPCLSSQGWPCRTAEMYEMCRGCRGEHCCCLLRLMHARCPPVGAGAGGSAHCPRPLARDRWLGTAAQT